VYKDIVVDSTKQHTYATYTRTRRIQHSTTKKVRLICRVARLASESKLLWNARCICHMDLGCLANTQNKKYIGCCVSLLQMTSNPSTFTKRITIQHAINSFQVKQFHLLCCTDVFNLLLN